MAKKNIVKIGDDVLRKICRTQLTFDERLHQTLDDMKETMYAAEGVGLAAPQIGVLRRYCVIDVGDGLIELINPVITEKSEETQTGNEGCLSIPGIHEDVVRPVSIRMRYLDENFVEHDEEFTGKPARVIQHEYDHIEGRVFTDHLAPLRRNLIKNKLQKMARGSYRAAYKTKR